MSEATPATPEKEPLWKRSLPVLGSLLIVVFIFGWVLPQFIDYDAVFRAIGKISAWEWVILLLAAAIRFIPEGLVFRAALPGLGWKQGASQFAVTQALNNIPPGGLDLIARFQMSRSWGLSAGAATTATIGTWFFGSLPRLVMPAFAVVFLAAERLRDDTLDTLALIGFSVVLVLTIAVLLMVRREGFAVWIGRTLGRVANFTAGLFRKELDLDFEALALEFRDETLVLVRNRWKLGFSAGLVAQFALFVVLLLAVWFVGLEVSWTVVFAAFAIVAILGAIPIFNIPGIAEAVYITILGLAVGGQNPDEVAAAVFVFRILTWLLPIPVGGLVFSRWRTWVKQEFGGDVFSSFGTPSK